MRMVGVFQRVKNGGNATACDGHRKKNHNRADPLGRRDIEPGSCP